MRRLLIVGVSLVLLFVGIALLASDSRGVLVLPWFAAVTNSLYMLSAVCIFLLAWGRYHVLREPAPFWIAMGFGSFTVFSAFNLLSWQGLLPDGRGIISWQPNTESWVWHVQYSVLASCLLAAGLSQWPDGRIKRDRHRREAATGVLLTTAGLCSLLVLLAEPLPSLLTANGGWTPTNVAWICILGIGYLGAAIVSGRPSRETRDSLHSDLAIAEMMLACGMFMAVAGSGHYDVWWYGQRLLVLGGCGAILFGLLMEYVGLFARERESNARLNRLSENAQDIIYRWEILPRERMSYVSALSARIIGYAPEEYYADPGLLSKIVHPDDLPTVSNLARGNTWIQPQIMRWIHKDGHTVWVEARTIPIYDDRGRLIAIEGAVRDVTERRLLEEQLLRAHRLETAGKIASQVAHDFNNLLGPLVGYPELIKMQLPDSHPALPFCDAMLQAAQSMADINSEMLALSRRGMLEQEPVDLNEVVRQAVEHLGPTPDTLSLELDLSDELMAVSGSSSQLLRMLSNLMVNAREAMQDQGTIRVKTENVYVDRPIGRHTRVEVGEYVRVSVADSGPGIPVEIQERVFDAFFTTKRDSRRRGCGLGLSVVQAVVEDHKGYLDLENRVGSGAIFSIYLPASRAPLEQSPTPAAPGGGETVLVVDDDQLQLQVAMDLLRTLGYRVVTASSGEVTLGILRENQVDLLILDMIMPGGMDGVETYRRVLEIRPDQPTIIVSGFAESDRMREGQELGVGEYLRKPLTLDRLANAVRAELARHG